jgi:hypothetical protein
LGGHKNLPFVSQLPKAQCAVEGHIMRTGLCVCAQSGIAVY